MPNPKPFPYETWLNRVFGATARQDPNVDTHHYLPPCTFARYFQRTLTESGTDLLRFSDKQVNQGMWTLFSPNGVVGGLRDTAIPVDLRVSSVLAIKQLYTDCFMPRARPVLGHMRDRPGSPVNSICYMLWDITPIGIWGPMPDSYHSYFDLAIEVLEHALALPHPACVESALHGLAHMGVNNSQRVRAVIEKWHDSYTPGRPELLTYAESILDGYLI